MKKSCLRFLALLLGTLLFCGISGCVGGPGIPGERKRVASNIAAEYFAIAEGFFELKNYSRAVEYYKLVLRNPDYTQLAEYKLARSYVFLQQWDKALSLYESLLKTDPENTNVQISLAYVFASSGDMKAALAIYEKLLLKPYYEPAVLENMILLYISTKDFEAAEDKLVLFAGRFPEHEKLAELKEKIKTAKEPPVTDTKLAAPAPQPSTDKK